MIRKLSDLPAPFRELLAVESLLDDMLVEGSYQLRTHLGPVELEGALIPLGLAVFVIPGDIPILDSEAARRLAWASVVCGALEERPAGYWAAVFQRSRKLWNASPYEERAAMFEASQVRKSAVVLLGQLLVRGAAARSSLD